jgi:hypothetical protein
MAAAPDPEYVAARRVLLDALDALAAHRDAVVVVGAQAVYLRSEPMEAYQDFTTDGDLALDPHLLSERPGLEEAMRRAGFHLKNEDTGHPEPGIWEARVSVAERSDDLVIPVDLIVPEAVAPPGGRRGARLGGEHGRWAARRAVGLEGALVDNSVVEIRSLDEGDARRVAVNVAGTTALIVAKLHKIRDRAEEPDRLTDKDGGDVVRLMLSSTPEETVERLGVLLGDPRSSEVTRQAIVLLDDLFGGPRTVGTQMAVRALTGVMASETITEICTGFTRNTLDQLGEAGLR